MVKLSLKVLIKLADTMQSKIGTDMMAMSFYIDFNFYDSFWVTIRSNEKVVENITDNHRS
jgi:hypothetical protein